MAFHFRNEPAFNLKGERKANVDKEERKLFRLDNKFFQFRSATRQKNQGKTFFSFWNRIFTPFGFSKSVRQSARPVFWAPQPRKTQ